MWVPVRIQADPDNWYVMHERSHLVCGPAGRTRDEAQSWCDAKNAGGSPPVMRGRLHAVAEPEADTPHIVHAG